jgi:hypothetical protein
MCSPAIEVFKLWALVRFISCISISLGKAKEQYPNITLPIEHPACQIEMHSMVLSASGMYATGLFCQNSHYYSAGPVVRLIICYLFFQLKKKT